MAELRKLDFDDLKKKSRWLRRLAQPQTARKGSLVSLKG
jgi:hypothetical protein